MSNGYLVGAKVAIHEFANTRMSSAYVVGAKVARHEMLSLAMWGQYIHSCLQS